MQSVHHRLPNKRGSAVTCNIQERPVSDNVVQANMMDVGAKAGYYTEKSPKMMLLEWCQQQKRPTPRYRTTAAEGDSAGKCKVYATQTCFYNMMTILCK